jgi:hypothetical protein
MIIGSPTEFAVIVAIHSVIGESRHDRAVSKALTPPMNSTMVGGNWFSMTRLIAGTPQN